MDDLLGDPIGARATLTPQDVGRIVNLASPPSTSFGSAKFKPQSEGQFRANAPTSIEGQTTSSIIRDFSQRPVSELFTDYSQQLIHFPRYAMRVYTTAARKYLRPWSEFFRVRPDRIVEGFRQSQRRGEVQIHIQRNVLVNVRRFTPNYAFLFLVTMFMFAITSPLLLVLLSGVGGGWAQVLRSDGFRTRPWTLQLGSISIPLGSNLKMLLMSFPTLFFLHFFMGPMVWSAALCSGGVSVVHAAIRDRDDDRDHGDDMTPTSRFQDLT